jgi:hypothetical protein
LKYVENSKTPVITNKYEQSWVQNSNYYKKKIKVWYFSFSILFLETFEKLNYYLCEKAKQGKYFIVNLEIKMVSKGHWLIE